MPDKFCYFDLFNGISGDMVIAAFIDAGFRISKLNEVLNKLNLSVKVNSVKAEDKGICGKRLSIKPPNKTHLHNYEDIVSFIKDSNLAENIKNIALKILKTLAKAEAKIHRLPLNKVHFHEIGAVDTIVDIVSFATIIHEWRLTKFFVSTLPFSTGAIKTQHGMMPVPVPAVLEILKGYKWKFINVEGEIITPTGAAILKAMNVKQISDSILTTFSIEKVGYGFGTEKFDTRANYLRVLIGNIYEESIDSFEENIYEFDFQVDDITPEIIGYIKEKLETFPVLDYMIIPVQMKKGRPGIYFKIFVREVNRDLIDFLFQETGTLGIRINPIKRIVLKRKIEKVQTPYGEVKCKLAYLGKKVVNIKPEFEDCKRIAEERNMPLKKLIQEISGYLKTYYE